MVFHLAKVGFENFVGKTWARCLLPTCAHENRQIVVERGRIFSRRNEFFFCVSKNDFKQQSDITICKNTNFASLLRPFLPRFDYSTGREYVHRTQNLLLRSGTHHIGITIFDFQVVEGGGTKKLVRMTKVGPV